MYEVGDITLSDKNGCNLAKHFDARILDGRANNYDGYDYQVAYMPHSCDEWVIGGVRQVRQMIADLQQVLMAMEQPTCIPPRVTSLNDRPCVCGGSSQALDLL
jgi:hypothetical protein